MKPAIKKPKAKMSEKQIISRKIIKDIIEHSIQIADFHINHRKFQKIYENRPIKKEENFVTLDNNFKADLTPSSSYENFEYFFISQTLGKIIMLQKDGLLKLYDFNGKNCIDYNLSSGSVSIISAELFEDEQNGQTLLLILLQNLEFVKIKIFSKNTENISTEVYGKNENFNFDKIEDLEKFDFKPYLNLPNVNDYIPNFDDKIKIMIFPKNVYDNNNEIVLNFTQFANKFLVFNFMSFSIIGNFIVRPQEIIDLNLAKKFINTLVNKVWTEKQLDFLINILDLINNSPDKSNKNLNEYKKLALIISIDEKYDDNELELIKTIEYSFNPGKDQTAENNFKRIIEPIFSPDNFKKKILFAFFDILIKLKTFLEDFLNACNAVRKNNFSLITSKLKIYQILFLKCFNRNINLKETFNYQDTNNCGYVDKEVAIEILQNFPIGLNSNEIDDILNIYNITDENNKYMYNYLFQLEEFLISKIIFSSDINKNPGNYKLTSNDKNNEITEFLLNSITNIELNDIIYLTSSNLIFAISPFNKNILIFKRDTHFSNKPQILENIGLINLNSVYIHSPKFIYYLEERNLLISQRTTNNSTELVIINLYKDLILAFHNKKEINFVIPTENNKNTVKNVLTFQNDNFSIFINFIYLKRNQIFALETENEIYIINPKSHSFNISLKMEEKKKNPYSKICREFCENPNEQTGESPFKIISKISLKNPLKKLISFSLGNDFLGDEQYRKYSSTDWIIIIYNNYLICSYSVNQLYISLNAKEIDSSLPKEDIMKLHNFSLNHMLKSLSLYYNIYLNNINDYYLMIERKKKEIINQISLNVKNSLIYDKELLINPKRYQLHTIYQLIKLLKDLNLHYNTNQLFEMFPTIKFENPIYDENSEFLESNIFLFEEKKENNINENNLSASPRAKNKLKIDLSSLESTITIFDSAFKKFAMYISKKKTTIDKIYKKIDEEDNQILDLNEFIAGSEKLGLLSIDYLNLDELKELFKRMDQNGCGCVTLDEFKIFFTKQDLNSILSTIKEESISRTKNIQFDIVRFAKSSKEIKFDYINNIIFEIQKFYSNYSEIPYEDVTNLIDNISKNISQEEIKYLFEMGYILLDDFLSLIDEYNLDLSEEEMKKVFVYFDQNNKNFFIYTRDLIKYLNSDKNFSPPKNNIEESQNKQEINERQFLLLFIGVMKKLIKLSVINFDIPPNEFTDKFILVKKNNKTNIALNYMSTQLIKENFKQKITNFLEIEENILFKYYLDIYNYGIIFKDTLKFLCDTVMEHIYEFNNFFDFNKFDTLIPENSNTYKNSARITIDDNNEKLSQDFIKHSLQVYDNILSEFAFNSQKYSKNLNILYNYLSTIGEEKEFLTQKEFLKFLKEIVPIDIYNYKSIKSLLSLLSENISLINEPTRTMISVPKIILFILFSIQKVSLASPIIHNQNLLYGDKKLILNKFNESISKLKDYDFSSNEILNISNEYLTLIKEGISSGLIIINKKAILKEIENELKKTKNIMMDSINCYLKKGNLILVNKFNKRLEAINELNKELKITGIQDNENNINEELEKEVDYSKIEIPSLEIDDIKKEEMFNLKIYQCGLIETFDYFYPKLNTFVEIIKIRKSFMLTEISEDGQNLLKHIEYSLKINHYLQNEYLMKSSTIKTFDNFEFLRNYGVCWKNVLINKRPEIELYIINEKIDSSNYISLYSLIKSNGGLLEIPELENTDMAFYILRYWGNSIIHILSELFKINVCLKYFSVKDFYVSFSGKKLKMNNLLHYSFCDIKGKIYSGPDLSKILLLLDHVKSTKFNEFDHKIDEIFYDSYIPPELVKKNDDKTLLSKIDSWCFGICLFEILFGKSPISFYTQLQEWCNKITDNNFDYILHNSDFKINDSKFYYNPFMNINEITENKSYFIKALNLESFSAIVNKTHLNLATENNDSINGIGIILDMINSCLSIDPNKRPYLSSLIECDLFNFEPQELILCNKFLSNILNYYSPDTVIHEKMLIPLRSICCQILRNEQSNPNEINNYQNFIFNVIRELNTYLFSKTFCEKAKHSEPNSYINFGTESNIEEYNDDDFLTKAPQNYYKNSIIVKYVIDTKIVDLIIFLVLRHFHRNLQIFKNKFKKELNNEINTNINNLGNKTTSLISQKKSNYNNEMKHFCGRLITALVDFLYNCVQAMSSYDHALSLYVENILLWIIKIFVGEENQLLSDICDNRDSKDELKKYIVLRTFMRDENIVTQNNFKEDELDQIFSVRNLNKYLFEMKSYWCPELYFFTTEIFNQAFGVECYGNKEFIVIKNYFLTMNNYAKNVANQLENPLVNNRINNYLSFVGGHMKIKYFFITTDYVRQLLSLADISNKIMVKYDQDLDPYQNLEDKRNALNYINSVLKNKNSYKIRGCLDFKIHFIIQKILYTNSNHIPIKIEIFNILKEISFCLVDMNEISWMFGNNYDKVFNVTYKDKTDLFDYGETYGYGDDSNWDSNFSLIDFMNKILIKPHTFVLYFTNKFLGVNLERSIGSYITYMKEFGLIFTSPLILKPIMLALQKPNENFRTKQFALDILFNLMLSNDHKIITNLNMTMCNFYEMLVNMVRSCIQLPKHLLPENDDDIVSLEIKADKYFKESVKNAIKIIIELQNPYIKTQIFRCPSMLKYMQQNKLYFLQRKDIDEIEKELQNFKNLGIGKIIFLINCFKCWIFHTGRDNIPKYMESIKNVMYIIHFIFCNEWSQGVKSGEKNCLVFDIVKLFEWLLKNKYEEFLFPKDDESLSMQMIISFMSKIRDNNLSMKDIIIKINKMTVAKTGNNTKSKLAKKQQIAKANSDQYHKNLFGNKSYTLQKVYNYITIKLWNIVYVIFSLNDDFYNLIFMKVKFGILLSEIYQIQYDTISLFLNQDNIDISILDNYMAEVQIRLGYFEYMINLTKNYDDLKMQFLKDDFINFLFKNLLTDTRRFQTDFKKLSVEFLAYRTSFPLKTEAISFLNLIFKKNKMIKKTEADSFIYDEAIRNFKVFNIVQRELQNLKNLKTQNEIYSVLGLFNVIISNNVREIIKIINLEKAVDYFEYLLKKDSDIRKIYPFIYDYVKRVHAGIEKEN